MENVRAPAVAGSFYPGLPGELQGLVDRMLADVKESGPPPLAIIAPHAGYRYSGPVAASVYNRLTPLANTIRSVILLGPAHRVAFQGLALHSASHFATPLGLLSAAPSAAGTLEGLRQVRTLDHTHVGEHSLEVHFPFLQRVLKDFTVVPILVGSATAQEVAEVIELLWTGPEVLVVISSDLSHFHDYHTARRMDYATARAIEGLRHEEIGGQQACGTRPLSGLLQLCRKRHLNVQAIDIRSSGDTAGSRDQVVGYGAFVVGGRF